jgi:hypothetical protein
MQHPHLTAMQIEYTATDAGRTQADAILRNADRSLANLEVMKTLDFTKRADIATIEDVVKRYLPCYLGTSTTPPRTSWGGRR